MASLSHPSSPASPAVLAVSRYQFERAPTRIILHLSVRYATFIHGFYVLFNSSPSNAQLLSLYDSAPDTQVVVISSCVPLHVSLPSALHLTIRCVDSSIRVTSSFDITLPPDDSRCYLGSLSLPPSSSYSAEPRAAATTQVSIASSTSPRSTTIPLTSRSQSLYRTSAPESQSMRCVFVRTFSPSAPTVSGPGPLPSLPPISNPIPIGIQDSGQLFPPEAQCIPLTFRFEDGFSLMTSDWSEGEIREKRRLVRFHVHREASSLSITFKAISQHDYDMEARHSESTSSDANRPQATNQSEPYNPSLIVVSCIWNEASGECFVTSVDTITVLEAIVATKFTIEEKNRVRRNLEVFEPKTVSKAKEPKFYRLIMGFPMPRPRTIEKDVKVFPWSVFDQALEKVLSKYSVMYAPLRHPAATPPP